MKTPEQVYKATVEAMKHGPSEDEKIDMTVSDTADVISANSLLCIAICVRGIHEVLYAMYQQQTRDKTSTGPQ